MITFNRFNAKNEILLQKWLNKDSLGKQFLSSYLDIESFRHLIDFKKRYLWFAEAGWRPIGFFDLEIESKAKGYFTFYLEPDMRGRGMGLALLNEALKLPEVKQVKTLEGGVEENNAASIKSLEKAGFVYSYTDEDGMLMYQKSSPLI